MIELFCRAMSHVLCTGEGKYFPLLPQDLEDAVNYAKWGDTFEQTYKKIQLLRTAQ